MTARRYLLFGAALLLGLVVLAAGAVNWLLYTEAGARFALHQATALTDGALRVEEPRGTLGGGLELEDVRYETDTLRIAATMAAALDVSWKPLGVDAGPVRLSDLVIDIRSDEGQPSEDSSSLDIESLLESLSLPIALDFDDVVVDGISVRVDGEETIAFDRLALAAFWQDHIRLKELSLVSPELDATLEADLELVRPFALNATANAASESGFAGLPTALNLSLGLSGDLDRTALALSEVEQGVTVTGEIAGLLRESRRWDLELGAPVFHPPGESDIRLERVVLTSSGWLDRYTLDSSLSVIAEEAVDVEIDAAGSLDGIDINSLSARHAAGVLGVSGRLDFPLAFAGKVGLADGRPGHFAESISPDLLLVGEALVRASLERIEISEGSATAGDASARFGGHIDLDAEVLAMDVAWRNLDWPLGLPDPDILSPEGDATIEGRFDDWTAAANAVIAPKDLPSGRFRITADGGKDNVAIDIVDGDILGGSLDGSATMSWGESPSWSARVDAESVETGSLAPAFPGSLTLALNARSLADMASARIEIEKLDGTLLDRSVTGSGVVSIAKDRLDADAFEVQHGDSIVLLDGDYRSPEGVRFNIDVAEVSDYTTAVSGDLRANGTFTMVDGRPLIEMTAESLALRVGDLLVDETRLEARAGDGGRQLVEGSVSSMMVGERDFGGLDLGLSLAKDKQDVGLEIRPLGYTLNVALTGSFDSVGSWTSSPWRGLLNDVSLTSPDGINASLAEPAAVMLSRDNVELDRFCVRSDTGSGLCAATAWSEAGLFSFAAELMDLPIAVVDAVVQTGFNFEQRLSGNVSWRQSGGQRPAGAAELRFSGGEIASDNYTDLSLVTAPGFLAFEVEEGRLLSGELDLPMPGTGFIKGSFLLDDVGLGLSSPVQGALAAELSDIDVFAAFLPDIDDATGRIEANLTLEGTVTEPALVGDAALIDATLTYFPLGLKLDDINLDGQIDAEGRIDLNGRFRAGEGVAEVLSSRESSANAEPGLHFEIRGDDLTVIDLPDINAKANVDLGLDFQGGRLDLAGDIHIPYARILPRNLAVSRIDESGDVVIVEGTLPDAPIVDEEPVDLEIFGKLSLGIGNDVEVSLDVAEAKLSGNADFEWQGDFIPIGNGRYDLVGSVQAFGQVLSISEGAIRFPNVPADNPNIRIRATREIYGNSQVKRAGILVAGSARRPTVEAYTQPLTTEERALALLLTGNDFDLEQGVGAIDFGAYIAPRLFLSYGVGVFARENIISARYDLNRGFGVRVTSGTKESGADLTYRIEN